MATRSYGRRSPEALPSHRMLTRRLTSGFPTAVDLRPSCGPVKDQGNLGSCTGHAFSSAMEWIFRKYLGKQPILSPLYLYAQELKSDGNFPNDEGSDGVTGCNVAVASGCCEDSLYPDASQKILEPTVAQNVNAAQYRMGAYHGLSGSGTALSILGDPTPWPVEIGFTVYDSFESDEVANSGVMPMPGSGESVLGGHEVLMVGYDVGATPTLRPKGSLPSALIQNSWGTGWALEGFFWMPLAMLDSPDTDLKILHSGHPW